ncbi:MAG TPA: MarR family transcriptional regulator [Candidatus Binataceae bacterium]|nr:MarR family transcriptional regulator [Candidatus Binataceae bacterium]
MPPRPINKEIRQLHNTLIDLVSMINRPQRDSLVLHEAGVSIDRALFPLLVLVERKGPLGVGDLADMVGRDYTTISRQLAKLEKLRLIARRSSKRDRRVREAIVTAKGRVMTDALDAARERLGARLLASWSKKDLKHLTRLMRRFADDLLATTPSGK